MVIYTLINRLASEEKMSIEVPGMLGNIEPFVLAVDNGGTNTRLQARLGEEPVGDRVEYTTPADYNTAIKRLGETAGQLAAAHGDRFQTVGFAVAGEVKDGTIVRAGELQAYGWCELPFRDDVAAELGLEPAAVVLLNDCVAAAKAQQVVNRKAGAPDSGYVETISTGFGGAGFRGEELIPDEPGHQFLRAGALCGCNSDGCAEAHISGSGIKRKFGIAGEGLPADTWPLVIADMVTVHQQMLERFAGMGFKPEALHFFGSVALKSPYVLPGLRSGLERIASELPFKPELAPATHGDEGGLVGAGDAAYALLAA